MPRKLDHSLGRGKICAVDLLLVLLDFYFLLFGLSAFGETRENLTHHETSNESCVEKKKKKTGEKAQYYAGAQDNIMQENNTEVLETEFP